VIGFLLSPLGRAIGGVVAILAIMGAIYWKGHTDGTSGIETELATRKATELEAARQIERDRAACDADPVCVQPDPFRQRVPGVRPDPGK